MKKSTTFKAAGTSLRVSLLVAALAAGGSAAATEMVYTPVNPSFGGNPLNGPVLLNEAQATNRHTDPDAGSASGIDSGTSPLQNFQSALENNILNRLASAATTKLVDANGNFVPGTFDTGSYTITIGTPVDGTVTVTTLDKSTGATTIFQVQQP
jgi:curli production assembly/transport component CsgF